MRCMGGCMLTFIIHVRFLQDMPQLIDIYPVDSCS